MFSLQTATRVHPGKQKRVNEDYVALFEPPDRGELRASGCLYVLADGVGGASHGERASKYAAEKIVAEYFAHPKADPADRLRNAIAAASTDIHAFAASHPRVVRMATTIVAAAVREDRLLVANVGDSRAYLVRDGQAMQLTLDHSVVGEMVAASQMTEQQAMTSRIKNRLTRSVGGEADVSVDVYEPVPLRQGDKVLLCSDGLTRYASRQKIAELTSQGSPDQIAGRCIAFANAKGGADNVSVVVVGVGPPRVERPPAAAAVSRPLLPPRSLLESMVTDPFAAKGAGPAIVPSGAGDARGPSRTTLMAVLAIAVWIGVAILIAAALLLSRPAPPAPPAPTVIVETRIVEITVVVTATVPAPAPMSPPSPLPANQPVDWEYSKGSAGTYVRIQGGSPPVDRRYGPFRNGVFEPASNGKFGIYVDIKGEVYVLQYSKDVTYDPFYKIKANEWTLLQKRIDQDPEIQLQLLADDNGAYRAEVTELTFNQTVVVMLPRAMTQ